MKATTITVWEDRQSNKTVCKINYDRSFDSIEIDKPNEFYHRFIWNLYCSGKYTVRPFSLELGVVLEKI